MRATWQRRELVRRVGSAAHAQHSETGPDACPAEYLTATSPAPLPGMSSTAPIPGAAVAPERARPVLRVIRGGLMAIGSEAVIWIPLHGFGRALVSGVASMVITLSGPAFGGTPIPHPPGGPSVPASGLHHRSSHGARSEYVDIRYRRRRNRVKPSLGPRLRLPKPTAPESGDYRIRRAIGQPVAPLMADSMLEVAKARVTALTALGNEQATDEQFCRAGHGHLMACTEYALKQPIVARCAHRKPGHVRIGHRREGTERLPHRCLGGRPKRRTAHSSRRGSGSHSCKHC